MYIYSDDFCLLTVVGAARVLCNN